MECGLMSQVPGGFLQIGQTLANTGVCRASCADELGSVFVCLF